MEVEIVVAALLEDNTISLPTSLPVLFATLLIKLDEDILLFFALTYTAPAL